MGIILIVCIIRGISIYIVKKRDICDMVGAIFLEKGYLSQNVELWGGGLRAITMGSFIGILHAYTAKSNQSYMQR